MGRMAKSNNGRINWYIANGRLSEYSHDNPKFMLTGRNTLVLLRVLESGEKATSVDGSTTWELLQDGRLKETSPAIKEIVLSVYDTETLRELLVAERESIIVAAEVEEALRSENNREVFFEEDFAADEEEEDAETF